MHISLLNISFIASISFILLQNLILPLINTNYCLLKEKNIIEKAESILEKGHADINSSLSELKNLDYQISINSSRNSLNFTELEIKASYSDIFKNSRSCTYLVQINTDGY